MSTVVKQLIRVQCFGVLEEVCGGAEREIEVEALPVRVDALLARLAEQVPGVGEYLPRTACAVGDTIVGRDHELDGSEALALIPPVSGG